MTMMKIRLVALLMIFFYSMASFAQDKTVTYLFDGSRAHADKPVDILHYSAYLSINPNDTSVIGEIVFRFTPLHAWADSVVFWSPDLHFTKAVINGYATSFTKRGDNLVIRNISGDHLEAGNEYSIEMEYTSRPKYDLFFIGWNEPGLRDNKQVWAHRPFHWLPYYHDRLTADLHITFDGQYQVFSNGVRESVLDNLDGTKTWHYRMHQEHPFFSTCLVIGDYRYLEWETAEGLPLELWYYSWEEDHAEPTYRYTREMFDFFKKEFGMDYPYGLYREAPVADYLYGAMETTTATVFGDYLAVDGRAWDGRNYVNVNAHELAHQWYGNCLSHRVNADVWLTESFATYYAKMFEREVFGEDYYQQVRRQELIETLEASKKDGYPVGHGRGGRARWYPKGSLVMDMMRDILGEEGFKASIKRYTTENAFSEVETADLLSAIYESTGKPMDWFFDQWILRGGEPAFEVDWQPGKSASGTDQVVVNIRQTHRRSELIGLFRVPLEVDVYYDDGTRERKRQWIAEESEHVIFLNPKGMKVSFVLFDPGQRLLKTAVFNKPFDEWKAQSLRASDMIDRYEALVALRDFPKEMKMETLKQAWNQETFHLTRGEILRQAGPDNLDGWQHDPDPLVRRAAIEAQEVAPAALKADFERFLEDTSYINVELSLRLLSRSFPKDIPRYLEITGHETGWRGMNIRMAWLEIAIMNGQREYLVELSDYASPAYEFETRINAFNLLKKLNYLDEKRALYLFEGYVYWNYKVSNAAKETILYFSQQNKYLEMMKQVLAGSDLSQEDQRRVRDQCLFVLSLSK